MVDGWGDWVTNSQYGRIRLGASIAAYAGTYGTAITSDTTSITFYLGVYLEAEYAINDTVNSFNISGNWTRNTSSISVLTSSGGSTDTLWALSGNHTYVVNNCIPGQSVTASMDAWISGLYQYGNKATISYSEAARIPMKAPTAVTSPGAAPSNGSVYFSWNYPTYMGGGTDTDTNAQKSQWLQTWQYKLSSNSTWTDVSAAGVTINGTNGTEISIDVRCKNIDGLTGPSVTIKGTPRTVPSAPTSFTANNSTFGQLLLSWVAPSNGGSAITGYTLKCTAPAGAVETLLTNSNQLTYTHNNLSVYTDYSYSVAAVNAAGTGTATTLTAKTLGGLMRVMTSPTVDVGVVPQVYIEISPGVFAWTNAQARVYTEISPGVFDWKYGS